MSDILRQRTPSSKQPPPPPPTATTSSDSKADPDTTKPPESPSQPPRNSTVVSQTLASSAYLANLLPTGTLLAFQILTPIFTHNGNCDGVTRALTVALLFLLAASCFLASFSDSFRSSDGQIHYGFATLRGMWLFDSPITGPGQDPKVPDLAQYRIRFMDWVHSVSSVLVFFVVALRDRNVVSCLYPRPSHEVQEVLDIVPVGVGVLCGLLFVVFPTRRHGIGYPVTAGKQ